MKILIFLFCLSLVCSKAPCSNTEQSQINVGSFYLYQIPTEFLVSESRYECWQPVQTLKVQTLLVWPGQISETDEPASLRNRVDKRGDT